MPRNIVKISLVFIVTVLFLFITYVISNQPYSLAGEGKTLLTHLQLAEDILNPRKKIGNDSTLFINVGFDKKKYVAADQQYGFPMGYEYITDREKLSRLLEILRQKGDYKYILLDIAFSERYSTEYDEKLFDIIVNTPRIVVPIRGNERQPEKLLSKSGKSEYAHTFIDPDFSKYTFMSNDTASVALKMYNEITGHSIKRYGPLYFDENRLVFNSLILTLQVKADDMFESDMENVWYNMGLNLLGDSIPELGLKGQRLLDDGTLVTKDKYIVIGTYLGDDMHSTYSTSVAGAVINYNAFISLVNGRHVFPIWSMVLLFIFYFILVYIAISREKLQRVRVEIIKGYKRIISGYTSAYARNSFRWSIRGGMWIIDVISLKSGYMRIIIIFSIFTYLLLNQIFDLFITWILFYLLNIVVNIYMCRRITILRIKRSCVCMWKFISKPFIWLHRVVFSPIFYYCKKICI